MFGKLFSTGLVLPMTTEKVQAKLEDKSQDKWYMNVVSLENQAENYFCEEAIDLLLLLEQELPKYIQHNQVETAKKIIVAIESFSLVEVGTEISQAIGYLAKMLQYLTLEAIPVEEKIESILHETLECLQILLMSSLMISESVETNVTGQIEDLYARFQLAIAPQVQSTEICHQKISSPSLTSISEELKQSSIASATVLLTEIETYVELTTKDNEAQNFQQLNTMLGKILTNYQQQIKQEENQQSNIHQLRRQVNRVEHLLEDVNQWTQSLATNSSINSSELSLARAQQLQRALELVVGEVTGLSNSVDNLDVHQHQINQQIRSQRKLLDSSSNLLKNLQTVSLDVILSKLRQIWPQLKPLGTKSAILRLLKTNIPIPRSSVDPLYTLLLRLCWYLFQQSIELGETRINLGKNELGIIEIESERQGNYLIIRVRDDGKGLSTAGKYLPGNQSSKSAKNSSFKQIPVDFGGNIEDIVAINQRLQILQAQINIQSHVGKGTVCNLTIPLGANIEATILCQVSGKLYAILISSLEQILFLTPEQIHATSTGTLIFSTAGQEISAKAFFLEELLFPADTLLTRTKSRKNLSSTRLFLLLSDGQEKFAIEIERLVGKQTATINSFSEAISPANYIIGSIVFQNQIIPVLDLQLLLKF